MSVLVGQTGNVGGQLYVEFQLLQSPCKSCYHIYPTASSISWDMVKVLVGHYPMTDPYLQLWTTIVQKVIVGYSVFAVRVSFDRTCMEIGNIS